MCVWRGEGVRGRGFTKKTMEKEERGRIKI